MLAASSVRCNTDHEQLADRPRSVTTTSTATGSGGFGGATGTGHTSTQSVTTGSGGTMQYVPDGADVLTLVHGLADAERIGLCLGRAADDGPTRFDSRPLPAGGLGYGESFTLSEAAELDFENDALELIVLTGEFDADDDCSDTLERAYWPGRIQEPVPGVGAGGAAGAAGAGGAGFGGEGAVERPPLRAQVLPTVPANSLVLGRHYVMVLAGCMGGPGVIDDGTYCGANFASDAASLRTLLVPVSRAVQPGRLSFQFLHAAAATSQVDVRSVPNMFGSGVQVYLTSRVRFGIIAPKEPYLSHSTEELGIYDGAELVVSASSGGELREHWRNLADDIEIADERSYLAILLGPRLGRGGAEGFNASRLMLLETGLGRDE